MKTKIIDHGDIKVLEIKGKITIGRGDVQVREAVQGLLDNGVRKIIMDLAGVRYADSSGIGELVSCYTTITNRGGRLILTNLQPKVYGLLQLTALISVFQIMDSNEDALQSFDN